jgi:hypothetical protein|tara:strand:+ start:5169 stop:5300 length:132 start_codon:yes stop_codon:yes gene_type:complete
MTSYRKLASNTKRKEIYDQVIKMIKWKKLDVPVKEDPFGDDKW